MHRIVGPTHFLLTAILLAVTLLLTGVCYGRRSALTYNVLCPQGLEDLGYYWANKERGEKFSDSKK